MTGRTLPISCSSLSRRAMLAGAVTCVVAGPSGAALADERLRAPRNRQGGETPSGRPVPRFVSLKDDEVFGRTGPGKDYPVATIYRQIGLPVRVIAETEEWRRVEDPQGRRVWIAHYMLSGRKTGIVIDARSLTVPLRNRPRMDARQIASLEPGVVVQIKADRPGWRQVEVGRYRGWLPEASIWGPSAGSL
jgi:SH3-like domain-containing protein